MADLKFSRKEIEDLARKVSTLEPFFSEKERALLLAIFASAAEHITVSKPGRGALPIANVLAQELGADRTTLEDLQRQLLNAYIPGNEPPPGIAAKITGVIPPPGP